MALVAIAFVVAGCATRTPAPVVERAPVAPARPAPGPGPAEAAPPPVARSAAAEPDWRPQTHTVKRGDTLYQIALEYPTSFAWMGGWIPCGSPT